MKKLLIIGLLGFSFAFTSCNRNISSAAVPSEVVTAFNQRYPFAQDVEWAENNGLYEAEFVDETGTQMEAAYRPDGSLIREN